MVTQNYEADADRVCWERTGAQQGPGDGCVRFSYDFQRGGGVAVAMTVGDASGVS